MSEYTFSNQFGSPPIGSSNAHMNQYTSHYGYNPQALAYGNSVSILAEGGTPPQDEEDPHTAKRRRKEEKKNKPVVLVDYDGDTKVEWDAMYALLVDYRKRSGDCYFLNPAQYPDHSDNQKLSFWTKNQRRLKRRLHPIQRQLLDKLDFDWSDQRTMAFRNRPKNQHNEEYDRQWKEYQPKNNHDKWLYMFAKVKAFKEEFGHVDSKHLLCEFLFYFIYLYSPESILYFFFSMIRIVATVPIRWRRDPALGKWVSRQRETRRNLKPEYTEKLNDIGFKWRLKHKGPGTPKPFQYDPKKVSTKLPDSVVDEKEKEPDDDEDNENSKYEKQWAQNFANVMEYKMIHGHCRIPLMGNDVKGQKKAIADGTSKTNIVFDDALGRWAHKQRLLYGRNDLRQDRRETLEKNGFFDFPKRDDGKAGAVHRAVEKALEFKTPPPKQSLHSGSLRRSDKRTMPTAKNRTTPQQILSRNTAAAAAPAAITPTPPRDNVNPESVLSTKPAPLYGNSHKADEQQQQQPPWMANLHASNSYGNQNYISQVGAGCSIASKATMVTPQQHHQILNNPGLYPLMNKMMNNNNFMHNAMHTANNSAMGNSFVLNNNGVNMNQQLQESHYNDSYLRHVVLDKRGIPVGLGGNHQAPPFSPAANQTGQRQAAAVTPAATRTPTAAQAAPIHHRRVDPFAESSYPEVNKEATRQFLPGTKPHIGTPYQKAARAPQPLHHSLNLYYAPQPDANLDSFGRACGESVSPAWKGKRKWRMICS